MSSNNDVLVNGNYDVNVWYSYENNTKTGVCSGNFSYSDKMNVPLTNNNQLTSNTEVIVNSLSDPNVVDVKIVGDDISFTVRKEMGIEIVGDTKIRVNVEDDFDDYTEIYDDTVSDEVLNQIDNEVKEDYLDNNEIDLNVNSEN